MRSLWRGAVGFGLVHIPCRLYAATEDRDVRFRQIHRACGTPIQYRRTCPHCEAEVEPDDIVRGHEVAPGEFVWVEDSDLDEAAAPAGDHLVEISQFVDVASVDPLHFERAYYMGPAEGGGRPYALLRAALLRGGRAAVATIALRSRKRLALLRVVGRALTLETMRYPDEIRDWREVDGLPGDVELPARELDLASELVDRLAAPWDPARHQDDYREAVRSVIARKAEGAVRAAPASARPTERYADLLAALEASVRAAERQAGSGAPADTQ